MTNLVYLSEQQGPQDAATNEDWTGALTFWWDAAFTNPQALDGIGFTMTVRTATGDPNVIFQGSTADGSLTLMSAGVNASPVGGAAYAVGDTFALVGGTGSAAVFSVVAAIAGLPTVVSLVRMGSYTVLPSNPVQTATLTGAGSGLALNLTWVLNALVVSVLRASFPATLKAGSYVYEIRGDDGVNSEIIASGPLTVTQGVVIP